MKRTLLVMFLSGLLLAHGAAAATKKPKKKAVTHKTVVHTIVKKPVAHVAPKAQSPAKTAADPALDELISAAKTCATTKRTVNESVSVPFIPFVVATAQSEIVIAPGTRGNCKYITTNISSRASADPQISNKTYVARYLRSWDKNISQAEIDKAFAQLNDASSDADKQKTLAKVNASMAAAAGTITTCDIPKAELIKRLNDLKTGTISIRFPDPFCTATLPGGANTKLNAL